MQKPDFLSNGQQQSALLYRQKVRRKTFLWGGDGVSKLPPGDIRCFLQIRVDEDGEPIRIGMKRKQGNPVEVGTLYPGESFTFPLKDVLGIYALVDDPEHCWVDCAIVVDRD